MVSQSRTKEILKSDLSAGSCVFCEDEDNLKSMHKSYRCAGQLENFSKMLLYCYNIKVVGLGTPDTESEICGRCAARLKDAFSFRKLVEAADETFYELIESKMTSESNLTEETINNSFDIQLEDKTNNIFEAHFDSAKIDSPSCNINDTDNNYDDVGCDDFNNYHENIVAEESDITYTKKKKSKRKKSRSAGHAKVKEKDNESKVVPPPLERFCTTCPVCNEKFQSVELLRRHYATHFPHYICDICGKAFLQKSALQCHIKTHVIKRHPCKLCDQVYASRSGLSNHVNVKHKGWKGTHRCKICKESFASYSDMNNHYADVHGHPRRVYTCLTCNQTFANSSKRSVHIKKDHLQQRNYPCSKCDRKFFDKKCLTDHMLQHTGEKNFHCDVCGKSFGRRMTLMGHLKIHIGIRNYKCEQCGKAFIQQSTLCQHVKRHYAKAM